MTPPDVAAFLLARIAEDEETARAAISRQPLDEWDAVGAGDTDDHARSAWGVVHIARMDPTPAARDLALHIARHDPARVLADCAALRKVVEIHKPYEDVTGYRAGEPIREWLCPTCVWIGDDEDAGGNRFRALEHESAPCDTLLALAQPFASHPDFPSKWRA